VIACIALRNVKMRCGSRQGFDVSVIWIDMQQVRADSSCIVYCAITKLSVIQEFDVSHASRVVVMIVCRTITQSIGP
jgi:hypothetical protein